MNIAVGILGWLLVLGIVTLGWIAGVSFFRPDEEVTELDVDEFLSISDAVEHYCELVADAIVAEHPQCDHDNVKRALSQELWMATIEIAALARSGARLT